MLQILLWHLSSQNRPIFPFLLSEQKLLARARMFSNRNVLRLCFVMLCGEFPSLVLPWTENLKAKHIWKTFSPCYSAAPKAANPAGYRSLEKEPASVTWVKVFCCESSIWFWLQRRNIFPLQLPWLGLLLPKRRTGMPSTLWGPQKALKNIPKVKNKPKTNQKYDSQENAERPFSNSPVFPINLSTSNLKCIYFQQGTTQDLFHN